MTEPFPWMTCWELSSKWKFRGFSALYSLPPFQIIMRTRTELTVGEILMKIGEITLFSKNFHLLFKVPNWLSFCLSLNKTYLFSIVQFYISGSCNERKGGKKWLPFQGRRREGLIADLLRFNLPSIIDHVTHIRRCNKYRATFSHVNLLVCWSRYLLHAAKEKPLLWFRGRPGWRRQIAWRN